LKYSLSNRISFDKYGLKFLYIDKFYSQIKSNQFFNHLLNEIPWSQEQINVFGKAIKLPRLTAYFSDKDINYSYSGIYHNSRKYTTQINDIKEKVEEVFNKKFNSVLLNRYKDGHDWHGYHSDDEKVLGHKIDVCSINFGAPRDFIFKSKIDNKKKIINLKNGSALYMMHPTQINYYHSLPRRTRVKNERINLTFRYIN